MGSIQDVKKYNAKEVEEKWQKYWKQNNVYKYKKDKKKETYSIDTPPPTLSGDMHIGHAFSYTQEDFVARYFRQKGMNVYYPFGTDDNGLPTERLVEKLKKVKSTRMQRSDFVKLCQDTIKELKPDFINQWIEIGMSCDFSTPYSTIDENSIKTAQLSFIELHKKGLLNRKAAPSIWCVNCQTAIAQAELEDKELPSTFNDIEFQTEDGQKIIIATTRPELLPACVCIFVHPDDKRYTKLVGKNAIVPLFNQTVPIFADESANPEKGSGILMICSYGDRFDVDAINRKELTPRVCITKEGLMNELAGEFKGLKLKDARKAILEELEAKELLKNQKQINHVVNVHDKCGTEIEFLATNQWFIDVMNHKQEFLDAGAKIKWHPEHMKTRYDNWVTNLNWDWCISRQRHFGVPFPVWYSKKDGSIIVADESELPVDPLSQFPKKLPLDHTNEDLIGEIDVMDTWMTSSVSPQIAGNWKSKSGYDVDFKDVFPYSLRPQGHDIIRTWAFYTVVKSVFHNNDIPWKNIAVSGNISDPKGEKMSKSKGNVVNPRDIINKYSADALRYWSSGAKFGDDLMYMEKDLVTGNKTVTKLWNASKFALMHLEDYDNKFDETKLEIVDKWLLSELNKLILKVTDYYDNYEYSKAKSEVDSFFKQTFCDNYLEIVKDRLYNPDTRGVDARKSAQFTLYNALNAILKMFAPIMPHITEEVFSYYFAQKENIQSIHISEWPKYRKDLVNESISEAINYVVYVIGEARKFKSENAMSLKEELSLLKIKVKENQFDLILKAEADLKITTKAQEIIYDKTKIIELSDENNVTITK